MNKKTVQVMTITLCVLLGFSTIFMLNVTVTGQGGWFWKSRYPDYALSGVPDFDQKQDNWYGPGRWVCCGPVSVANSLWWLDSEFEPGVTPPPAVSDGFGLVTSYGSWDDHGSNNVQPLVWDLTNYMQTSAWTGTEVHNMKQGIDQYLTAKKMQSYFFTRLLKQPAFGEVEKEVERCQDVVLLLGFWQEDPPGSGIWFRTGGHYVTVAGVDSAHLMIAFSDPYIDAAEMPPHGVGMPGMVLPPEPPLHPHPPPFPPGGGEDTVHNNATYVSYDFYMVTQPSPSPGGLWSLPDYSYPYLPIDLFMNFDHQNCPSEYEPNYGSYNPQLPIFTEVEYAVVTCPWYAKGQYDDYAPSGMPDFGQKQLANWTNPWPPLPGSWSYCGPVSVANSLWWYDSKYEPNPVAPPTINDGFKLVQSYNSGVWDDHDPWNVQPFVGNLAWYMDTDGQRTGLPHCGTEVHDMQAGIAQYLSDKGVNPLGDCNGDGVVDTTDQNIILNAYGSVPGSPTWDMRADIVHNNRIDTADVVLLAAHWGESWGKFYVKLAPRPDFDYLKLQIKMCEDVVLLIGLWESDGPTWNRVGGHFVTANGVDTNASTIAISDPFQDNAEQGGQGRVIPPPPHPHTLPPDTLHNNATYVSHDYYTVGPSPSPGGPFGLSDYNFTSIMGNIYGQNRPNDQPPPLHQYYGMPVFAEIEYAVVVSCRGPTVVAGSQDGNVYALDYMGNLLWTYQTGAAVVSVAMGETWSAAHGALLQYVVAGSLNNGLYVFNGITGALLWSKSIPISESYDGDWRGSDSKTVGISADGSYIVAATWNGTYLYDNAGNEIWHFIGYARPEETCVRISADGKNVVCCDYLISEVHFFSDIRDGTAGWSPGDGTPIWNHSPSGGTYWVAIDGCGRYVAVASGNTVILYDRAGSSPWYWTFTRTGFVRVDMPWDGRSVIAVNADPTDQTGAQLVCFSDMHDGQLGWGPGDGTPDWMFVPTPDSPNNDLYSVSIAPDGKIIATGPATTNVYLLSNTGAPQQTIADGVVNALDLTFTGEYGVEGDRVEPALTGTVRFFTKTRNEMLWTFATPGKINSVAIEKMYPCLQPFPNHDVDVTNVTRFTTWAIVPPPPGYPLPPYVKTYVAKGQRANNISITLSNHGNYTETVEVTLYAYSAANNTMVLANSTVVTIAPGVAPVVSLDWNVPAGVAYYGNYTLHAIIGPVSDENNLADSRYIDSGLVVTGLCDINGDRKVNLLDTFAIDLAFGSRPTNAASNGAPYRPDLDWNCDYTINSIDSFKAHILFNTNYTP